MKIAFEIIWKEKDDEVAGDSTTKRFISDKVNIINVDTQKVIGRIFTPSGTGHNNPNSIQICGFDQLFDYWGCGVFFDTSGNPKRDIQLFFKGDGSKFNPQFTQDDCPKCYYPKNDCKCDDFKIKSEYEVYSKQVIDNLD